MSADAGGEEALEPQEARPDIALPVPGQPLADAPLSGHGLRALTRAAARGHGGAPWYQLVGDAYTYVFAAAVGVAMAFQGASALGSGLHGSDAHGEAALDSAWLVVVAGVALLGPALAFLVRIGPVGVGGPGALWWLPTPADRRSLLRPTALAWFAGGIGLGAAAGACAGAVGRTGNVAWLAGAGAGIGLCLVVACMATQLGSPSSALAAGVRARRIARVGDAFIVVAALGWIALTILDPPFPHLHPMVVAISTLAVGLVGAIAVTWRIDRIPGGVLRTRGQRAGAATHAFRTLDMRALGRVLTDSGKDRRRRSSRLRLVRGQVSALWVADALLVLRSPWQLTALLAAVGLPLAVASSGASTIVVALALLGGGLLAGNVSAVGGRAAHDAPVLDRLLALSGRATRLARLAMGSLVALAWAAVVLGVLPIVLGVGFDAAWFLLAATLAPGVAAAGLITAYRKEADWSKPLVVTPQGAYPPGVVTAIAMGPILTLLCVLPTAVALAVAPGSELPEVLVWIQAIVSAIMVAVASHVRRDRAGGSGGLMGMAERMQERADQSQAVRR